ncbi:MAG: PDZ domain-containing protein [Campylobacter sp.]|nr:PDZ domain-containing protein [Campylobacter sp.]MBR2222239.1 PDZ domain-containing protein [Campylobacter sp.]MBR2917924.1 PDZ domain-containing protein [Campylobacter sp.]
MRKILAAILVVGAILHAAPEPTIADRTAIYDKMRESQFNYKDQTAISLNGEYAAVVYDKANPLNKKDYIKFDPYLGLYLVRPGFSLRGAFMLDELDSKQDMWVMTLQENITNMGHIKSFGSELGQFDELSFKTGKVGMLVCDCASMVGISLGDDKFIPNRYLKHFLRYDDVYYGDIGVKFSEDNATIKVQSVNPFGSGKELKSSDIVVSVNGKTPKSLREINEMVLFADKGSVLKFEIKRDGKPLSYDVKMANITVKNLDIKAAESNKTAIKKTQLKPKFSSEFGASFNKSLVITSIKANSKAAKLGLKAGDKIMQIDGVAIKSISKIDELMKNKSGLVYILVSRDDFQFFVRVNR